MSTAAFYILSTARQQLTLRLLFLLHNIRCCLLNCVQCLSVTHTVQSVSSVPLCPLQSSAVCPLSLSISHCTLSCFCVTISIALFYSLSTACHYLTMYLLLVLCHYVHCSLLCLSNVTQYHTLFSPLVLRHFFHYIF
jgi:hypothetical protein